MVRKTTKFASKKYLRSEIPDTVTDSSPPTCNAVATATENGKQNLVSDEDSPLSNNSKLKKASLKRIKTDGDLTSGEKLRKYACKHIGCSFATAYSKDLKRHSRIHSGEQPYQCGTCERRFSRSDKLKIHERLHADIKTLSCTKCAYITRCIRNFEKHLRNHSDEVEVACRSKCPTLTGECQYFVVSVNPDTVPLLSLPSEEKVDKADPPLKTNSGSSESAEITARRPVLMPSNADRAHSVRLKKFFCDYSNCQFISAYKKDLTRHMRIHSGEQPFECGICQKKFNRSDKLKIHERSHSGEKIGSTPKLKKYVCHHADCRYASAYRKDLRRHMRVHSGEHPFQCGICKRKFKRSDTLKLHEQSHVGGKRAEEECNNLKESLDSWSDESRSSVNSDPGSLPSLPCDEMSKAASDDDRNFTLDDAPPLSANTEAFEHVMTAFGTSSLTQDRASNCGLAKRYLCYYAGCKFASAYPKDLTRHLRIHSGEQPFECANCNEKFNRFDKLKLHQQTEMCGYAMSGSSMDSVEKHCSTNPDTNAPLPPFGKPEANAGKDEQKSMSNEDLQIPTNLKEVGCLTTARKRVSKPRKKGRGSFGNSKKYACNHAGCQFISAYKKDLVRHLRVHSGEKPFECGICNRKFNRSDKLKLHERTHTGDKPYKCDKCDYAAAEGSGLRIHMRKHSEEKLHKYRCHICLYACRFSKQLASHMKIHDLEAPYSCKLCQCKFKASTDLKQHELLHTGDEPFECTSCDYKCSIKGNLKMHISLKQRNKQKCFPCPHPGCLFTGKSRQGLGLHCLKHRKGK